MTSENIIYLFITGTSSHGIGRSKRISCMLFVNHCPNNIFFQTEMTAEEKRQEHQRELANKMNEEARERMKGLKGDNEEKKSVTGICITLFIG